MASRPEFPAQALQVLAALCEQPTTRWQDGSALAVQTGRTPERRHSIVSQPAACGLAEITRPAKTRLGQSAGDRYRVTAGG
jgi:hypothetical protein